MRIALVSDTHDRILASLFDALAGVDEILHAGDVCGETALAELEAIAPVTAVLGNMDSGSLAERHPEELRLDRGGIAIGMVHGHRFGRGLVHDLARHFGAWAPDLVVFGHTHEALDEVRGSTRYFNPGTAGGIGGPATAGILEIANGEYRVEHVRLDGA
ncbi:MAG: metallophosphoesterase family protein [Gemmatimonadota bacterium]